MKNITKKKEWENLHKHYEKQEWIEKTNIFAKEVISYFPEKGKVFCLGDGYGQDGRYFAKNGYDVNSTDISDYAIEINKKKVLKEGLSNIAVKKLDLTKRFPFENELFDVVYAHLSLHYFSEGLTKKIFKEIRRVLKSGGIIAAFVNSVNDPEFNTGKRLEQELFEVDGKIKRYFSMYSMEYFAKGFRIILLDDKGETYKDRAVGVHNLVRFVGEKN